MAIKLYLTVCIRIKKLVCIVIITSASWRDFCIFNTTNIWNAGYERKVGTQIGLDTSQGSVVK